MPRLEPRVGRASLSAAIDSAAQPSGGTPRGVYAFRPALRSLDSYAGNRAVPDKDKIAGPCGLGLGACITLVARETTVQCSGAVARLGPSTSGFLIWRFLTVLC